MHVRGRLVRRVAWAGVTWAGLAAAGAPLAAQMAGPPLTLGGLLRAGARVEPDAADRRDGFEVFDARLSLEGGVGIIFDYFLQGAFEGGEDPAGTGEAGARVELLDARLTVPFRREVRVSIGRFKAPFGGERLRSKDEIRFLERAMASDAIAPGRQVGIELHGDALEGRLAYRGGAFNGNGRAVGNDNGAFLWAGRVQYNTVGPIEFYEDLVVQVGANLAYSSDSAVRLGPGLDGSVTGEEGLPAGVDLESWAGDRLLFGMDLHLSYRGWALDGEYLRADLDPDAADAGELDAWGGYVEALRDFYGAIQTVARYEHLAPAVGPDRKFLILGINVFPDFHAKLGLQYALGIDGSPPGARIADGQFILLTQLSF